VSLSSHCGREPRGLPADQHSYGTDTNRNRSRLLSEVRIFASTSPDFAKIAATLGANLLASLGAKKSLLVAVPNDSEQAIDSMRVLYLVDKANDKPIPRVTFYGSLAVGEATLLAPMELQGAVAASIPLRPGTRRATRPRPPEAFPGPGPATGAQLSRVLPRDLYQGAQVTASVDSVTFSSGLFIGADTHHFFPRLVAEDAAWKSFFADLLELQSRGSSQLQVARALSVRRAALDDARVKTAGSVNRYGLCEAFGVRAAPFRDESRHTATR
jgi:hypothetical protein